MPRPGLLPRLLQALAQPWKDPNDAIEITPTRSLAASIAAEVQIVSDRQIGKDASTLGDLNEPGFDDVHRRHTGDIAAIELDGTSKRSIETADGVVQRRLAGAVAAQQCHDLAFADDQIDTAQDFDRAVARPQARDFKHAAPRRHHDRDRLRRRQDCWRSRPVFPRRSCGPGSGHRRGRQVT